jgi:hypothetical protein
MKSGTVVVLVIKGSVIVVSVWWRPPVTKLVSFGTRLLYSAGLDDEETGVDVSG